mmetsp:Transcript_60660/g.169514  ORF Transcript_60660/g.169514 Transcript_60660/m.169514 type:complete len:82 (-) Transcript_60660:1464-1709(-)
MHCERHVFSFLSKLKSEVSNGWPSSCYSQAVARYNTDFFSVPQHFSSFSRRSFSVNKAWLIPGSLGWSCGSSKSSKDDIRK